MMNVSWQKLKLECPMDINDIVKIAQSIENDINNINNETVPSRNIFGVRAKLNVLMRNFTAIFYEEGFISDDDKVSNIADKRVIAKLIENISRLVGRLDELESTTAGYRITKDYTLIMPFLSEIESILYGDIYYVLKKAVDKGFKNRRHFLYNVYETSVNNASIFGGESRMKRGAKKFTFGDNISPVIAKEALSEEGQEKLANDYENDLQALEKISKKKVVA